MTQTSMCWNNDQKTKTKLSSATPNRDKMIHCQRKRRKKHPASNVAAESAPHPAMLRKPATSKDGHYVGGAGDLESATVFPGILPFCWTCKSTAFFFRRPRGAVGIAALLCRWQTAGGGSIPRWSASKKTVDPPKGNGDKKKCKSIAVC